MGRVRSPRPALLLALLGLLLLAVAAAGCGSEGGAAAEPAKGTSTGGKAAAGQGATSGPAEVDPYALDRALLEADRRLDKAGRPLFDCLDDPGCEVLSMPQEAKRLVTAIDDEIDGLETAMALDPDGCAQGAAEAALRAYQTMRGVAQAADEGKAYRALTRAAEQGVDVTYALAGCSPFRGKNAAFYDASQVEVANAERRAMFRVARCGTPACVKREGAALARTVTEALEELRPDLDRVQDRCARELSRLNLSRLDGYRRFGAAAKVLDENALRAAGRAIDDTDTRFSATYLRCLEAPELGARDGTS